MHEKVRTVKENMNLSRKLRKRIESTSFRASSCERLRKTYAFVQTVAKAIGKICFCTNSYDTLTTRHCAALRAALHAALHAAPRSTRTAPAFSRGKDGKEQKDEREAKEQSRLKQRHAKGRTSSSEGTSTKGTFITVLRTLEPR